MNTTTTAITPEMIEVNTKIQKYTNKLNSINSNSCKELQDEINKFNDQKQDQLQIISEMKNDELQTAKQRHIQQITQLNSQKDEQISNFKQYCIKHLQKLKKDIKSKKTKQLKDKDIDLIKLYKKFLIKNDKTSQKSIRYTRTRYANKNKLFPPQPCLTKDEIESDLMDIINNAKEKNIEIPMDILNENNMLFKRPKKKTLKYKTGVVVNENDKLEIERICQKVGINIPQKALRVALYGYSNHVDVYLDIFEWVRECNGNEQNNIINGLKSTKLRDIQVKLSSNGTVGRKNEMANGIKIKLKELTNKYKAKYKQ